MQGGQVRENYLREDHQEINEKYVWFVWIY